MLIALSRPCLILPFLEHSRRSRRIQNEDQIRKIYEELDSERSEIEDLSYSKQEEAYDPSHGDRTPEEKDTLDTDILDIETRHPAAETRKNGKGTSVTKEALSHLQCQVEPSYKSLSLWW